MATRRLMPGNPSIEINTADSTAQADTLRARLDWINRQRDSIGVDQPGDDRRMPCGVYALDERHVLCLPRDNGDSRYPYGRDGMNFWVYASGYMHSNEGLFSHFLYSGRGAEPNIGFFAGLPNQDGDGYTPLPLLPVPMCTAHESPAVERFTVLSASAAYFVTNLAELSFAVRVFVADYKNIYFTLSAENKGTRDNTLYLASYFNPFLRHQVFETSEDIWFKQVRVLERGAASDNEDGPGFMVSVNEDVTRTRSITNRGVLRRQSSLTQAARITGYEATTARRLFVGGSRHSLHNAKALFKGTFGENRPVCTFTDDAIAGDITHLKLPPASRARIDFVFACTDQAKQAEQFATRPVAPSVVDGQLLALEQDDLQRHRSLSLSVEHENAGMLQPRVFDAFVEHLKRQVEFCSLIKGYVQLSPNSLIGVRDVCQAIESMSAWRAQSARDKLIEVLGFTAPDGRCFRQYSLPSNGHTGRMDLRPFIDQGVWVISCVVSYLKLTGDYALLNEQVGYHEIVDEAAGKVQPGTETDSVLEHLFRIMRYLLDHRDHGHTGCVRALYGDWNDALDGLGVSMDPTQAYGTGVSVMATLQVYQNCHEMIGLLQTIDPKQHAGRIAELRRDAESIRRGLISHAVVTNVHGEKRILHGWGDRRSYLVGGFNDPDKQARDGLTSNAFWVLSGMLEHDESMAQVILDAYGRLDSKYGLRTFTPAFPADVRGVGRIGKLPPGTAENGACYVHATAFAIMSLFKMGEPRRAWEQLIKAFPFTDGHDNISHSPFVMPNSYGYNPDLLIDGQNMNDWQTGSSNVVLKTIMRYVFGFEPAFEGLWIQPAGWAPFEKFNASCVVRGCKINLTSEAINPRGRKFTVNGRHVEATYDPRMGIDKLYLDEHYLTEPELNIHITN